MVLSNGGERARYITLTLCDGRGLLLHGEPCYRCVNHRRVVLMMDLSENMDRDELQSIIFLLHNKITKNQAKQITSFLDVVCVLEQTGELSNVKLELIEECVRNIRRNDLIRKIQSYRVCDSVKLSVCETGVQHIQVSVDVYDMNYDLRGVCVIIDCTGSEALLTHTFRQLGFHVFPYTQTEVCEVFNKLCPPARSHQEASCA
ncbi:hypothetical protein AMELA_G00015010 [Ameiurus melas]|uniref:DED domain-containing protein n=1 Tax=Ameiurus melas TaxID=219545 RepID=A0A7J6BHX9_AMEME|nr:hypothetical protein AMELA_G00015010 [Ameiurus melas]